MTAQELQDRKWTFLSRPLPPQFAGSATLNCTSAVLFGHSGQPETLGPILTRPTPGSLSPSEETTLLRTSVCPKVTQRRH